MPADISHLQSNAVSEFAVSTEIFRCRQQTTSTCDFDRGAHTIRAVSQIYAITYQGPHDLPPAHRHIVRRAGSKVLLESRDTLKTGYRRVAIFRRGQLHELAGFVPGRQDHRRQDQMSVQTRCRALLLGAAALRISQPSLGAYFRHMCSPADELKAITAAAHKLDGLF
jgi:hypothetical protein